jgi:nucleotide-binding universal stress UspA family protein
MYKHLLIATDGSDLAGKAVTTGLELAKHLKSSKVTVVTVTEPWTTVVTGELAFGFPLAEYEKATADNAARILSAVTDLAKASGVTCAFVHAKVNTPPMASWRPRGKRM